MVLRKALSSLLALCLAWASCPLPAFASARVSRTPVRAPSAPSGVPGKGASGTLSAPKPIPVLKIPVQPGDISGPKPSLSVPVVAGGQAVLGLPASAVLPGLAPRAEASGAARTPDPRSATPETGTDGPVLDEIGRTVEGGSRASEPERAAPGSPSPARPERGMLSFLRALGVRLGLGGRETQAPTLARAYGENTAEEAAPRSEAPPARTFRLVSDKEAKENTETLLLPSGSSLRVRVHKSEREQLTGLMHLDRLPEEGVLETYDSSSEILLWSKNILIPLDYVVLDSLGMIIKIIPRAPPSPPGTPGRKVPLTSVHGRHVLILEAGRAESEGLRPGQRLRGRDWMRPSRALSSLDSMQRRVLSGKPRAIQGVLRELSDNNALSEMDDLARRLSERVREAKKSGERGKAERYAKARSTFYAETIRSSSDFPNASLFVGALANAAPRLWATHVGWLRTSALLYLSPLLFSFSYLPTFLHEGLHYLAAKLVGARTYKFRVFLNGSGLVSHESMGGWRDFAVSMAPALLPILGSALGALVLYLGYLHIIAPAWAIALMSAGFVLMLNGPSLQDRRNAAAAIGRERRALELTLRIFSEGDSSAPPRTPSPPDKAL